MNTVGVPPRGRVAHRGRWVAHQLADGRPVVSRQGFDLDKGKSRRAWNATSRADSRRSVSSRPGTLAS